MEVNELTVSSNKNHIDSLPSYDFTDITDVIDYAQNEQKNFSAGENIISINELLERSQFKRASASGDVTGVFTSQRMDTGTPGVTWDYVVDYTVSPMPSGIGWYFKSVNVIVNVYKEFMFYTWATAGIIDFTQATYSLSPSSYPTSLKVNITLQFEIWTSATGAYPVTYTESHNHTTTVKNVYG